MGKSHKKSDKELLALFDGKELDKEEIKKIRIEENQAAVVMNEGKTTNKMNQEMNNLFSSTALLPNENTCNQSITSTKMLEFKKAQASMELTESERSKEVKKKYLDNQANFKLSTMGSHKDICKQIKDKKDKAEEKVDGVEEETPDSPEKEIKKNVPKLNNNIVAIDFLKKRFGEIQNQKKEAAKKPVSNLYSLFIS